MFNQFVRCSPDLRGTVARELHCNGRADKREMRARLRIVVQLPVLIDSRHWGAVKWEARSGYVSNC
jgi:hypothetical protein